MRVSKKLYPFATRAEDREGPLTFDFEGTLLLNRNVYGVFFEVPPATNLAIKSLQVFSTRKTSRGRRFIDLLPIVWRFCK
jgi:hypothetical protein